MPQEKNHMQVWALWGRERNGSRSLPFGIMWAAPPAVKWWYLHGSAQSKGWTLNAVPPPRTRSLNSFR